MKQLKLIKEERTIQPFYKKTLKVMKRQNISDEISDIWVFLSTMLQINNIETKMELIHLHMKYYELELEDLDNLSDEDLSDIDDINDIDDKQMALALNLNVHPMLLEEQEYTQYGLTVYKNLEDYNVYAIGDDGETDDAMIQYFDGYIDNIGGLDNISRYELDDFIELDSYAVDQYVSDESEQRVEDLSEDEVIDEAGYDKDSLESELDDLKSELDDLESEREDLESELDDLKSDNDEGENDDEIEEMEEKIVDFVNSIIEKEDEIIEKEGEIESLYETAKEELIERYRTDTSDSIEYEGVDYFVNIGYSFVDAVSYFCNFDETGFESYLAENEDRGSTLAAYDGNEESEQYNGEWYYIYRID